MIFDVPVCLLLLIVVVYIYLFIYCLSCLNINRVCKTILFLYNCFTSFHLFDSLARTSCYVNLNYNPWKISFRVRVRVLSLSQSIFTDFAVPVCLLLCLLLLIGVVLYFICLYIVYHV